MLLFLKVSGGCYNACEMGLGKTIQAITCFNTLKFLDCLIICPAVMRLTWKEEFLKWGIGLTSSDIKVVLNPSDLAYGKIHIISYDMAARESYLENILNDTYDLLICDEFHYMKSRKAKRTKAVLTKIWECAKYKIGLSGTPFTQSVVDGYTAFNKFAPDVFDNFYTFANRYSYIKRTPWGDKYFGVKNAEELSKIIRSRFYVRYLKEEVLKELPPKQFQKIMLPPQYGVTIGEGDNISAIKLEVQEVLDRLNKGESVGVVPKAIGALKRRQGLAKIGPIVEFVTNFLENDIPIVLFGWHKDVILELTRQLSKYKPVVITGEVSGADRQRAIEAFQRGDTNLFIGQMAAAGVGITLTRSSNVVLAELDWSPTTVAQATDRVHRMGQQRGVIVYFFVVQGSLEEIIENTIINKARTFAKVLN